MNHKTLVKTLKRLMRSLKTVEINSQGDSYDFKDHLKFPSPQAAQTEIVEKAGINNTFNSLKKTLQKVYLDKEVQTDLKSSDANGWDYFKSIISERETTIKSLTARLEDLESIKPVYEVQKKELEDLRQVIKELLDSGCNHCKEKLALIEAERSVIIDLKKDVLKKEEIEVELEDSKNKLKESLSVIHKKNLQLEEMEKNLEEIIKKIEEVKQQKELLEKILNKEKSLKPQIENMSFSKESPKNIYKYFKDEAIKNNIGPKISKESFGSINKNPLENKLNLYSPKNHTPEPVTPQKLIKPAAKTPISKKSSIERTQHEPVLFSKEFYFDTLTSPEISYSAIKSRNGDKHDLKSENLLENTTYQHTTKDNKIKKADKIMKALNMTKDEYLTLSKNIRIELYKCLFPHKEKCGANCEHLKKAMLIRYKEKGISYPTKKYNII